MNSRLSYNRVPPEPVIRALSLDRDMKGHGFTQAVKSRWPIPAIARPVLAYASPAIASDAPSWMHALANVSLPTHDEKTDAVLLYSETNVTIVSADKIKTVVREAYKILRPQGRALGTVLINVNSTRKVTSLHGWCIPAQGKDYEVKDKLNLEVAPPVEGGELSDDV